MQPHTPAYDNKIALKYSVKTLENKGENKAAFQEECGWVSEPKRPIVCIPSEVTDDLNGKLLSELLPGLLSLPIELIVRGKGSEKYGKLFTQLSKEHKHRMRIVPDNEDALRSMLAAADIALFVSKPSEEELLENCLRYAVLPVSGSHPLLENYNPVQESGNAFIYEEENVWLCFATLARALETFKFPFDWRTIQRHAMETVPHKAS